MKKFDFDAPDCACPYRDGVVCRNMCGHTEYCPVYKRWAAFIERKPMIKPTVGRVVWFYKFWANQGHKGPLAALITAVHSDCCVNLAAFSESGVAFGETSVRLVQGNEELPQANYCAWMPYQVGQAQKTEALEKQLASAGS